MTNAVAPAPDPSSRARHAPTTGSAHDAWTITFRDGLFGFPECRRFILTPAGRDDLFWLRSLDHEMLAFLLVDPFLHFKDYAVDLGEAEVAELGAATPADLVVLSIVTLPATERDACTANLQGPLVLHLGRGQGRQVVLNDTEYGLRCPLDLTQPVSPA